MGIDSSIYQNIQAPPPVSPLDNAQKVMSLASLAYQSQQQQIQMQTRTAMMQAYAANTDPQTGEVNKPGVVSFLARVNPMAAQDLGAQFAGQDKAAAEAKSAQLKAATDAYNITGPAFDYMASLPGDQRAAAYPKVIEQLKAQGVDTSRMEHTYDDGLFNQYYGTWQKSKPALENMVAQANIAKTQGETAKIPSEIAKNWSEVQMAPLKRNAEQFGSRSPNAELTSQYSDQAKPIRQSQIAMKQMLDNYGHPSPQGDASLMLNAFKIKFPTAPDVNSLEELSKSQSVPDQWKKAISQRVNGMFDQGTRDNLMRDGISTFRANKESLDDIRDKYQARARFQNVNDPTITIEPAVDKTYKQALKLQDKIGPYVPTTERDGSWLGKASNVLSKMTGGEQGATASSSPPAAEPMIRIKAPNGRIKLIPASQKGAAIANGGSVVK